MWADRHSAVAVISVIIISFLVTHRTLLSQSSPLANGVSYLKSTQNADGSWGGTSTSLNHSLPTTAAALEALRALETSASTNQTNAIQFLSAQAVDVNPFLAARINALAGAANTTTDLNALLAS